MPRHQMIVARILGETWAPTLTVAIGLLEIGMAGWVLSRLWPKVCAWTQIVVVLTMNLLEFALVPDLLLFGHANLLFATLFVALVFWHSRSTN